MLAGYFYLFFKSSSPILLSLNKRPKTVTLEQIPDELKEVLIGSNLGDLYMRKRSLNTSLHFKQCINNEPYIIHLYTLFQEFCKMTPKIKDAKLKDKIHPSIFFDTLTYEAFNYYYDLFYKNKKKVVPSNIEELLTARSLGYWAVIMLFFIILIIYSLSLHKLGFLDSNIYLLSGIPITLNGVQITPVKSYLNADIDKKSVYDENTQKKGIYC